MYGPHDHDHILCYTCPICSNEYYISPQVQITKWEISATRQLMGSYGGIKSARLRRNRAGFLELAYR